MATFSRIYNSVVATHYKWDLRSILMKLKDIAIVLLFVVAIATCHEISGQLQGIPHVYVV